MKSKSKNKGDIYILIYHKTYSNMFYKNTFKIIITTRVEDVSGGLV